MMHYLGKHNIFFTGFIKFWMYIPNNKLRPNLQSEVSGFAVFSAKYSER